MKKCGNCQAALYCSKTCQRQHWSSFHKRVCQKGYDEFTEKRMRTVQRYENAGSRPRCMLDDFITFEEAQQNPNDHVVIKQIQDYHAWVVDEKNEIHDYPVTQIGRDCLKWTEDVVYRPWDIEHVSVAYPAIVDLQNRTSSYILQVVPLTHEQKIEMIQSNSFPINNCLARATTMRDINPRKYALVIGSLGFRQEDGSIFWEFG